MNYGQWSPSDVARAFLIREDVYIDEILVMAHDPEFPGKLGGGYVERSICPIYSDGYSLPRVFKVMPWFTIEGVDHGLKMASQLGYAVEYAPGCGPESRELGCKVDCGATRMFGGCVDE
jgi:hypothetical protein